MKVLAHLVSGADPLPGSYLVPSGSVLTGQWGQRAPWHLL